MILIIKQKNFRFTQITIIISYKKEKCILFQSNFFIENILYFSILIKMGIKLNY